MTTTYCVATLARDSFGAQRSGAVVDVTADDVAAMVLGEFQGAADLEDGLEFADGDDANGEPVRVFRREE